MLAKKIRTIENISVSEVDMGPGRQIFPLSPLAIQFLEENLGLSRDEAKVHIKNLRQKNILKEKRSSSQKAPVVTVEKAFLNKAQLKEETLSLQYFSDLRKASEGKMQIGPAPKVDPLTDEIGSFTTSPETFFKTIRPHLSWPYRYTRLKIRCVKGEPRPVYTGSCFQTYLNVVTKSEENILCIAKTEKNVNFIACLVFRSPTLHNCLKFSAGKGKEKKLYLFLIFSL